VELCLLQRKSGQCSGCSVPEAILKPASKTVCFVLTWVQGSWLQWIPRDTFARPHPNLPCSPHFISNMRVHTEVNILRRGLNWDIHIITFQRVKFNAALCGFYLVMKCSDYCLVHYSLLRERKLYHVGLCCATLRNIASAAGIIMLRCFNTKF
jgi:hypothetical protein